MLKYLNLIVFALLVAATTPAMAQVDIPLGEEQTQSQAPDMARLSSLGSLRRGARGEAVKELQAVLKHLGYDVSVDGVFGRGTENIVKQFQRDNGLGADGVIGSKSIQALNELSSRPAQSAAQTSNNTPSEPAVSSSNNSNDSAASSPMSDVSRELLTTKASPGPKGRTRQHDPRHFRPAVEKAAERWGIDPDLLMAVFQSESKFDPNARSYTGARGLGQMTGVAIDETRRLLGFKSYSDKFADDPALLAKLKKFDKSMAWIPELNIEASAIILAANLKAQNGNVEAALTGYNAGNRAAGRVRKYGFAEAKRRGLLNISQASTYAPKVLKNYRMFQAGDLPERVAGPRFVEKETEGLAGALGGIR